MKRTIVFILIMMGATESAVGRGTYVEGYVKEAETGLGIQGAEITVNGPPPSYKTVANGFTDETGYYFLQIDEQGFQPGTYSVWITAYGYDDLSTSSLEVFIDSLDPTYDVSWILPDFLAIPHPPPTVDAGYDFSTTDSFTPQTVQLNGSVTDTRTLIFIQWSKISGPGNVSFLDSSDPKTSATFDALGRYELELWAMDDAGVDSIDTVIVDIGGSAPGLDFQYYELTLEGPDRVEGEPGSQVEYQVDFYLTAATHTISAVELVWPSHGHSGSSVTVMQTVDPKEVPVLVYSTTAGAIVPADGSSLTRAWELQEARVDGPWGWVPAVVANSVEITIAPIGQPPAPTGHHGGDRYNPLADCAVCHGTDLTGDSFGMDWAPSCYDCHGPVWAPGGENPPPPVVGGACSRVAHWPLDEGSGILTQDLSGNGHDGTLVGSPRWIDGPAGFGQALSFSRINYVEVPHEAEFDLTAEITVTAWANIEMIGAQWSPIVAKGNSAWRLSTRADQRRFHFAVTAPQVGSNWVNGDAQVALGQWHHVAGTYDGSEIRLYIDGVEDPASPVAYAGPVSENDFPVWIGGNAAYPGQGFTGRVDDVRIYDCALTQDEIASLMGIPSAAGSMHVREVINNGPIADQNDCEDSLASGLGAIVDYETPVLNILDSGANGHFGDDHVFGVVTAGNRSAGAVDQLSMEIDGILRIPARQGGDWTFGINSDDGFTLYLPGRYFRTAVNGELISYDDYTALRYTGSRAVQDTLGTVYLPAGDHFFRLTYHEAAGGAALEFFAARGVHTQFDPDAFRLVGQPDIGLVAVPGLCGQITMTASQPGAWAGGAIDSLADALDALTQGQSDQSNVSGQYQLVNHGDPDTGGADSGYLPSDDAFPNDVPGRDENDFAVRVTGQLDIPVAGTYQIGFNSDDGAYLRIHGEQWKAIVEDATGNAQISGDRLTNDSITGWSFTAGEIELQAGCHSFEAVMFDRAGGAFFELFGRGVSDKGIHDPAWHLLKINGAKPRVTVQGLQLVEIQ